MKVTRDTYYFKLYDQNVNRNIYYKKKPYKSFEIFCFKILHLTIKMDSSIVITFCEEMRFLLDRMCSKFEIIKVKK